MYPPSPESTASIAESPAKGLGRKLVRLVFFAIGAAVVVGGGYFGYQYFIKAKNNAPTSEINTNVGMNAPENSNVNAGGAVNVPVATANNNANINIPPPPPADNNANVSVPPPPPSFSSPQDDPNSTVDTDHDGLTDYQEVHLYHTDPNKADTDGDGLSDRDEVITWKTDPNKADTDGDGFSDGSEVKNGYNPLGPGKLLPPVTK